MNEARIRGRGGATAPFWRKTHEQLANAFAERRYLLEEALRCVQQAREHSEGSERHPWLCSADRLLRLYDAHVRNQHTLALEVIAQYGSLLDQHASEVTEMQGMDGR